MARAETILQRQVASMISLDACEALEMRIADSVGRAIYGSGYPDTAEVTSTLALGQTSRLLETKVLIDGENVPQPLSDINAVEWVKLENGLFVTKHRAKDEGLLSNGAEPVVDELDNKDMFTHATSIAENVVDDVAGYTIWETHPELKQRISDISTKMLFGVVVVPCMTAAWYATDS